MTNQCLHDLAYGPSRKVKTWPMYFVNGYKFHTSSCSEGKRTNNSGVCVKGTGNINMGEDDFYGILEEVLEIEYPGLPMKRLILFACEWFDPVIDRGMKIYKEYGIVEVNHTRRYSKYDPFIYAQQATQVYYAPYPNSIREKSNWWVVIKTKPRSMVENVISESAYQNEEVSFIHPILEEELIDSLHDIDGGLEEVEPTTLLRNDIVEDEGSEHENEDGEELEDEDEDLESTNSYDNSENSNDDDKINYLDYD